MVDHRRGHQPMRATAVAVIAWSTLLLAPAAAQFDPQHDHLTCYHIKGQQITTTAVIDNQFGHEDLVQLTPALLCLPTQKTVTPPGVDPLLPTAVRHFKCYKVRRVKGASFPTVRLTDQFGTEVVRVKDRQLFCTPVLKEVMGPTTTTVTTTTVTTTSVTIGRPVRRWRTGAHLRRHLPAGRHVRRDVRRRKLCPGVRLLSNGRHPVR